MDDLRDIREKITEIDNEMAELFQKRMEQVAKVAEYKKICGLPILDAEREQQVIDNGAGRIEDENLKPYYLDFLKSNMELSRRYQNSVLGAAHNAGKICVNTGSESYEVKIERGALDKVSELLDLGGRVLVVTDSGVPSQYAAKVCDAVESSGGKPILTILEQGEGTKNLGTFADLCQKMFINGFTRKDCVIAVGGGVVGDVTGFAASCYMRGIDFYNIPTTLLSQVDSSVGGKTAIDFCGVKNIVGTFYQPKAVIIDPDVLEPLDDRQFASGCAEIIKIAATFDAELFELIEKDGIRAHLEEIIARALSIKAYVVENDEKESGLRKVLNFGHTLGHGIESATDLLHGECVAMGMIPMIDESLRDRLKAVLEKEGLPVKCKAKQDYVIEAVMHDKKAEGGEVVTVRVKELGTYCFEKSDKEKLTEDLKEVL